MRKLQSPRLSPSQFEPELVWTMRSVLESAVDQIDAAVEQRVQQRAGILVGYHRATARAAQLHRSVPERADLDAGPPENSSGNAHPRTLTERRETGSLPGEDNRTMDDLRPETVATRKTAVCPSTSSAHVMLC